MRLVGVGIVAHLADVGAAVFVVGHRHWTRDERFGGEEVHAKTVEHAEGLCGVAGGCGRDAGESAADGVGRRDHAWIGLGGKVELCRSRCEKNRSSKNEGHEAQELAKAPAHRS